MNIAIDGPAGAGKSTVAKRVADRLNLLYIDTGAMYRAVTWLFMEQHATLTNEQECRKWIQEHPVSLKKTGTTYRVYIDSREVTDEIRTPEVTGRVSEVSSLSYVREELVEQQRKMALNQEVVMDGRDIGTHVLPDAEIKIFLTASIEERANRRLQDLVDKGYQPDVNQLKQEIAERDKKDSERETSPLKQAEDAQLLDTTGLSIEEVVTMIVDIYRKKAGHA